jgi:L-asparaginase
MGVGRVAVASLGGTITMRAPDHGGGVAPVLGADDLVRVLRGAKLPEITSTTLLRVPSASMTCADVVSTVEWASAQVDAGALGCVVVQGTDTLEESAYLADCLWAYSAPIVFTGAMRPADHTAPDGAANLEASIRVAAAPEACDRGALVVLDDVVHAARDVIKTHSHALSAFSTPEGPVGRLIEKQVVLRPRIARPPALARPPADCFVPLLETYLGDDGVLFAAAVAAGASAVCVAGFGAGHVSRTFADAVSRAVESVPVVVASRAQSGGTLRRTYGFAGSEIDLVARGAVLAGTLPARKARALLWVLASLGTHRAGIETELGRRGSWSG